MLSQSLRRASLVAVLVAGLFPTPTFAIKPVVVSPYKLMMVRDRLLLSHLAAARRVTVQRIAGPPADPCQPHLAAPSDTIPCYPATRVATAPKGEWVRRLLNLMADWAWIQGPVDPMFNPTLGVRFQSDSLDVDWILSLEPLTALIRTDGVPVAWATVPEEQHLELLELMRRPFPKDPELVARHIIEEERHLSLAEPEEEEPTFELEGVGGVTWEGCHCWVLGVHRPSMVWEEGKVPCYDKDASPVVAPPPVYPEFAREARIQGKVLLHALVGPDGQVKKIKVLRGITGLTDAAVDAVRRWTFKPASKDGEPICVWTEIPVDFHF